MRLPRLKPPVILTLAMLLVVSACSSDPSSGDDATPTSAPISDVAIQGLEATQPTHWNADGSN